VKFGLDTWQFHGEHYADRDELILPEVWIGDWHIDVARAMRPAFDMVWNAFGLKRSFNYDKDGNWSEQ